MNIGGYSCFLVIASRSSIPWGSNNSGIKSSNGNSSSSSSGCCNYGTIVDTLSGESSEQPYSKRVKKF